MNYVHNFVLNKICEQIKVIVEENAEPSSPARD